MQDKLSARHFLPGGGRCPTVSPHCLPPRGGASCRRLQQSDVGAGGPAGVRGHSMHAGRCAAGPQTQGRGGPHTPCTPSTWSYDYGRCKAVRGVPPSSCHHESANGVTFHAFCHLFKGGMVIDGISDDCHCFPWIRSARARGTWSAIGVVWACAQARERIGETKS